MAGIKTTKELKREMGQIVWDDTPDSVIKTVFDLINSFEASIKDECKKCPIFRHHKIHSVIKGYGAFSSMIQKCKECKMYRIFGITDEELRSLLEGEGGGKKG